VERLRRREREMDLEKQRLEERLLHLIQYEQGQSQECTTYRD